MWVGLWVGQKQMCHSFVWFQNFKIFARGQVPIEIKKFFVVEKSISHADIRWLAHNGPAIWGGCVTRRKHRVRSCYFSRKAITVQGGYGAVFAVQVQILLSITRVAVQF
jgi:hypothetical protein